MPLNIHKHFHVGIIILYTYVSLVFRVCRENGCKVEFRTPCVGLHLVCIYNTTLPRGTAKYRYNNLRPLTKLAYILFIRGNHDPVAEQIHRVLAAADHDSVLRFRLVYNI